MKKQCSKCKKLKDLSDFYRDRRVKLGTYSSCKLCHTAFSKSSTAYHEWRQKNGKKYMREYMKKWRLNNPDIAREYIKNYKIKNRKNPKYRIDTNMGYIMWIVLRGKKEGRDWENLVGYSTEDLMKSLESKFDNKMNWNNYGSYWEIDHIKPKSLFKYTTAEDPEFKKCWALENLQPLEKIANMKKSNKHAPVVEGEEVINHIKK